MDEFECPKCKGTGHTLCPVCKGSQISGICSKCEGNGVIQSDTGEATVKCPDCEGTGKGICQTCLGEGEVTCPDCNGTSEKPD